MRTVIFFDVEASSLAADSYPIEVGWAVVDANGQIESDAILVRPEPSWTDWAEEAERVHGISRELIEAHGRPASEVAARLDEAFGSGVVFSDYPSVEVQWSDRLYAAAGYRRMWRIGDALPLLRATVTCRADGFWLSAHLEDTRLHRADADARVLAEAYVELQRRRRAMR